MKKDVYISDKLYRLINDIASVNDNEQMMVFGGRTIGNTVVINEESFRHINGDSVKRSDSESMEVSIKELEKQMIINKELGNDTFFMAHSHPCKSSVFEFMFGDLSDDDEIISQQLRNLSSKYNLDYYDGITTGKNLYFWSTIDDNKYPKLMDCFVDNYKIDYNKFTQLTEDLEHILKY